MEPALKQRLLGAAVLVALAVTFLPLVVMEPAPESGASTVPLKVPAAPEANGEDETIVMPIGPDAGPGVAALPELPRTTAPVSSSAGMMPPPTAGGDFAVTFGRYATAADAERVVGALRASQLPAYHEPSTTDGRTLHRVLVGPYANRAMAESARLRAAHVNDRVASRVIALDAGIAGATPPPASASTVATRPPAVVATTPLPPARPVAPPAVASPPPAAVPAAPPVPTPAASSVGFAVQLGAFANAEEAARLRDRARGAGFPAFVERVETADGALSRVRVGPVTDRAAADGLRAQVASRLGVNGIVRSHP